jgi:NADPH2:quinone reductase
MPRVVAITRPGGPEVLSVLEHEPPPPAAGEIRLRQAVVGVNFVDVYHRTGLYPLPQLPAVPGVEGAGIVDEVGPGVEGLAVGDRVAYAGLPVGGYAEVRNLPATRAVRLPAGVDERTAAAAMLRGVTAHMLLTRVAPVGPGTVVLVHAAAGGLGLLLTQWARRLGATVVGTVGSPAKAELARAAGAHHVVVHGEADVASEVRRWTGGAGVDVAYDGIGGETLRRTLDAVRPFGTVVSLGQASGSLPDLALTELGPGRSLSLARPSVLAYAADVVAYRAAAAALFAALEDGLRVRIGAELPLEEAARAHALLEGRATTGSVLLRP